jgi:CRP/FNR family transcriptional regulator, cyclic AMP receptor protein
VQEDRGTTNGKDGPALPAESTPAESTTAVPGFWSMLGAPEQAALRAIAEQVTYSPGTRIFSEGEPSSFALVISSGWVKVASGATRESETALALRRSGDLVGESASADSPRSATVVALGEVCALRVSAPRFTELLHEHPNVDQALKRTLRGRRMESDRMRMDVGKINSDKRLAQLFLDLAESSGEPGGDGAVLDIPLSQEEFGQLICASTGTVERTLHRWRLRGIVSTSYRRHVLLDLPALSRIAGRPHPDAASSAHGGS